MVPTEESLKVGRITYITEGLMVFLANIEVFTLWNPRTSALPRPMEMIVINLSNFKWEKNYPKNIKWENHPEKGKSCWNLILKTLIFHMSGSSSQKWESYWKRGRHLNPTSMEQRTESQEEREREMVARGNREQLPLIDLEKILYPSFSVRVSCFGL